MHRVVRNTCLTRDTGDEAAVFSAAKALGTTVVMTCDTWLACSAGFQPKAARPSAVWRHAHGRSQAKLATVTSDPFSPGAPLPDEWPVAVTLVRALRRSVRVSDARRHVDVTLNVEVISMHRRDPKSCVTHATGTNFTFRWLASQPVRSPNELAKASAALASVNAHIDAVDGRHSSTLPPK